MVMLNIELARTIQQDRNREIEASVRSRRLLTSDPMLPELSVAETASAQADPASTPSPRPVPPAATVASR